MKKYFSKIVLLIAILVFALTLQIHFATPVAAQDGVIPCDGPGQICSGFVCSSGYHSVGNCSPDGISTNYICCAPDIIPNNCNNSSLGQSCVSSNEACTSSGGKVGSGTCPDPSSPVCCYNFTGNGGNPAESTGGGDTSTGSLTIVVLSSPPPSPPPPTPLSETSGIQLQSSQTSTTQSSTTTTTTTSTSGQTSGGMVYYNETYNYSNDALKSAPLQRNLVTGSSSTTINNINPGVYSVGITTSLPVVVKYSTCDNGSTLTNLTIKRGTNECVINTASIVSASSRRPSTPSSLQQKNNLKPLVLASPPSSPPLSSPTLKQLFLEPFKSMFTPFGALFQKSKLPLPPPPPPQPKKYYSCVNKDGKPECIISASGVTLAACQKNCFEQGHCDGNQCVSGSGSPKCNVGQNSNCTNTTHADCVSIISGGYVCQPVPGPGKPECNNNLECNSKTHLDCKNKKCSPQPGGGGNHCMVPPAGQKDMCDIGPVSPTPTEPTPSSSE